MTVRFRSDIDRIEPYRPGRSIASVAAEFGLDRVVKLASNEYPDPPFPEVIEVLTRHLAGLNRYPDDARSLLTPALAEYLAVPPEWIWCGGASNELALVAALAMGGEGTSAVFGWPSFGLYQIGTRTAFATDIAVPLDEEHRFDLEAMAGAVRGDTTLVYVCNPNNPSSTHVSGASLTEFIESLPSHVLVLVDEAYAEFATADDYSSMIPLAVSRENVVVTRTFSKVYGLAGLRIGYAVAHPDLIAAFRRIQLPFSVGTLAEVAATEALRHQDRVRERAARNAAAIAYLMEELRKREIEVANSQTNFVYAGFGDAAGRVVDGLLRRGFIVRPVAPEGWLRITAGAPEENEALLSAIDRI